MLISATHVVLVPDDFIRLAYIGSLLQR